MRVLVWCLLSVSFVTHADVNRIDTVEPDAPHLAQFGKYDIGVRTITLTDEHRLDIVNIETGGENVHYDRKLTVEIWYPALLMSNQKPGGHYTTLTRNPAITATLRGTAVRNAAPMNKEGRFPLVIISHGYPGNRYLMSHLGENLASKGYVVVAIDHRDSTYDNQQAISGTLYNRPLDQLFVLDQMALASVTPDNFLRGMLDADNTGVVGYSMGGYGLINNLGGGFNDGVIGHDSAPPNDLLFRHATGNPDFRKNLDPRIKAGFAIAPWGMNTGVWRQQDLLGISVPTFYLAGSADTVAGYENGTQAIFKNAINSDRYLLTFHDAGHNAGAPIPLPDEIRNSKDQKGAGHYTDAVWDTVRMNNIMDHFVTAYFDYQLKGNLERESYLESEQEPVDDDSDTTGENLPLVRGAWKGFKPGTAQGLSLEHLTPGQ